MEANAVKTWILVLVTLNPTQDGNLRSHVDTIPAMEFHTCDAKAKELNNAPNPGEIGRHAFCINDEGMILSATKERYRDNP